MYVNWYKVAKIQQEAGLREILPTTLLMALLAVMGGSGIWNAAQRFNVDATEIENALANPQIMQALQSEQITEPEEPQEPQVDQERAIQENIIARTIYAEGRNEPIDGLMAIATVIYNRGQGQVDNMISAIQQPKQFSCWNKADASDWTNMKQGKGQNWEAASQIAKSMMDGTFQPIGNWNHYYNPSLADPYWAYTDKSKTQLHPFDVKGNHRFMIL